MYNVYGFPFHPNWHTTTRARYIYICVMHSVEQYITQFFYAFCNIKKRRRRRRMIQFISTTLRDESSQGLERSTPIANNTSRIGLHQTKKKQRRQQHNKKQNTAQPNFVIMQIKFQHIMKSKWNYLWGFRKSIEFSWSLFKAVATCWDLLFFSVLLIFFFHMRLHLADHGNLKEKKKQK